MLFAEPHEELSDEEIVDVLRQSIVNAGRLPRHADLHFAGVCAEHLVAGLRAAGLLVVRPVRDVCIRNGGRRCGGNWTARYKISRPPTTISVVAKIGRNTASGTWAEM
jgi:hypothetical protein